MVVNLHSLSHVSESVDANVFPSHLNLWINHRADGGWSTYVLIPDLCDGSVAVAIRLLMDEIWYRFTPMRCCRQPSATAHGRSNGQWLVIEMLGTWFDGFNFSCGSHNARMEECHALCCLYVSVYASCILILNWTGLGLWSTVCRRSRKTFTLEETTAHIHHESMSWGEVFLCRRHSAVSGANDNLYALTSVHSPSRYIHILQKIKIKMKITNIFSHPRQNMCCTYVDFQRERLTQLLYFTSASTEIFLHQQFFISSRWFIQIPDGYISPLSCLPASETLRRS